MSVLNFSTEYLTTLCAEAQKSSRQRQHRNIHKSYEEPCQRLFNAIEPYSYIPPHRHTLDSTTETLLAIQGLFALIIFDDHGAFHQVIKFGTEYYQGNDIQSKGVEIPSHLWHTVLALVPNSILFELKAGPFNPDTAKGFPSWAPKENNMAEVSAYLHKLYSLINPVQ